MAFERPVLFGYRVDSNLSDVIDKNEALSNILLDINDLQVIRGVASGITIEDDQTSSSASRFDFQSLSRLDVDVYRTLDRFGGDTDQYDRVLRSSPGADVTLRGNLTVNGGVGASAIRYKRVNDTNDDLTFLDISTSRVSAWSTTTNPPANTDPIYYGGEVRVISGGKLTVNNLTFGAEAEERLFDSEIPTHTVNINIDGTTYQMYAMKSIPLTIRGFFRRFDGEITFTNVNDLKASWRIINVNDSSDTQSFANQGQNTSSVLQYRSVNAAERDIEFYYPPDNITSIDLQNIDIRELPAASLPNLNSLNLAFNDIKEIPDLTQFAPNVSTINLDRNPLYLSGDETYRNLNADVMARIPTSTTVLRLGGAFFGSVRTTTGTPGDKSVIEDRLPNLTVLDLGRGGGGRGNVVPFLSRDDFDPDGFLPTVPDSCRTYNMDGNDFRRIPSTGVTDISELRYFNVDNNGDLEDDNFESNGFPNAANLEYVNLDGTDLAIPTLQNKTQLEEFFYRDTDKINSFYLNDSSESSYKFAGCSSLRRLYVYRSDIEGFIPKFKGNGSFEFFHAWPAFRLTGGRPGDTSKVLFNDTFEDCRDSIRRFYVRSTRILRETPFDDKVFNNLSVLERIYWHSYGRTGGSRNDIFVPDVSSCPRLTHLNMPRNNFSGPVPSFVSNNNIRYVNLAVNKLSGGVPEYANRLRLYYINLRNNNLTSFEGFNSLPALRYLYLHNNSSLSGSIPDLSSPSPNLRRVFLFNCSFDGYTRGSFAGLRRIDRINLANNNLGESDLNNIITDLHTVYQNVGMNRVRVNLRGQSGAPNYNPRSSENGGSSVEDRIRSFINTLRDAGWIINGVDG